MGLIEEVSNALDGSGFDHVLTVLPNGTPAIALFVPGFPEPQPSLVVLCPPDSSKVVFQGRCETPIPRDRYWDALLYVNGAAAQTAFARMYLDDYHLQFRAWLLADAGQPPDDVDIRTTLFVSEASALCLGVRQFLEGQVAPEEAAAYVMTEFRKAARQELT